MEMHPEFMTHYEDDDSLVVIIKCKVAQRKSKWTKLFRLMNGSELEIVRINKHHSPIHALRGTQHEDAVHRNIFLPPQPPQQAAGARKTKKDIGSRLARLFEREVVPGKVLPSSSKAGGLHKATAAIFGNEWSQGPCVDLRVFWLLEVHRRVLALEGVLTAKQVAWAQLAQLRAQAFGASKYVVIDAITLQLPMLLGHLRGGFNVQADATYRLVAVVASIHPLVAYGAKLTALARRQLPQPEFADASACAFERPFPFLPESMRTALAARPAPDASANIARRVEKEADDVRELLRTGRLPRNSPIVRMFRRLRERGPQLLAADTHERALTRFLPPTPSLQDAVYDPAAFLAQMDARAA
jgi:hypothetical protein